mgnify:CR=1 FL=1
MFKHLLSSSAGDLNWMGVFALVTFFIIFFAIFFQAVLVKKDYVKYMSKMPLEDGHIQNSKQ